MKRALLAVFATLAMASCGERCALRHVRGCEYTPSRTETYFATDSDGHRHLRFRRVP